MSTRTDDELLRMLLSIPQVPINLLLSLETAGDVRISDLLFCFSSCVKVMEKSIVD
jgi:hypothetical protein